MTASNGRTGTAKERRRQAVIDGYGRQARIWDRSLLKPNDRLATFDGATYVVHESGAFVRTDKDRRTPKERKRARRAAREAAAREAAV